MPEESSLARRRLGGHRRECPCNACAFRRKLRPPTADPVTNWVTQSEVRRMGELLAQGLSRNAIAMELSRGWHTVNFHIGKEGKL